MNKFLTTEWDLAQPAHNYDVGHDWLISATIVDENLNQMQYHLAEVSCDKDMTEKDARIVATAMSKTPQLFCLAVMAEHLAEKVMLNASQDAKPIDLFTLRMKAKEVWQIASALVKQIQNPKGTNNEV